jgi:hypothetical protein
MKGSPGSSPGVGFRETRAVKEQAVVIGDPRLDGLESVSRFEDHATAVSWRDQLRSIGVGARCVADHPLDRSGRGDIYLMVPPQQWSRASEIVDKRRVILDIGLVCRRWPRLPDSGGLRPVSSSGGDRGDR